MITQSNRSQRKVNPPRRPVPACEPRAVKRRAQLRESAGFTHLQIHEGSLVRRMVSSIAEINALDLLRVSSYSASASLSATTPQPAWT